jgi:glycosyltransferase involved in cell wall biosynthesis
MASVIRVFTEHSVGGDVVDSHPTWRPQSPLTPIRLVAAAERALLRMPATDVAHVHVSERGSFLREGSLITLAHKRGLVTVVTIHGASFVPFAHKHPRLVSAVLGRADLITCLDDQALAFARQHIADTRSELVPNPVFVDARYSPADGTEELVVFAGEIGLRKGADVLHRAWRRVARQRPQARCLMVGPMSDFAPPSTDRLEVRKPVSPAEMERILRDARVVALPSRAEGMPMVLMEAMSLGRPFVSTPVGGIPELASEGGILVAVGDENDLADRLVELLAHPIRARVLGERGRQFCMDTRSIAVIDDRMRELYVAAARHASGG